MVYFNYCYGVQRNCHGFLCNNAELHNDESEPLGTGRVVPSHASQAYPGWGILQQGFKLLPTEDRNGDGEPDHDRGQEWLVRGKAVPLQESWKPLK